MENRKSPKIQFDFATVFGNCKKYIDRYNANQTTLTNKLNANHRATAELITRLYLKQLNNAENLGILNKRQFPGFSTFNSSLAKCKGCTNRTIINHKERLKRAGFIIKEEHRGADGVELWVDPVVLGMVNLSTSDVDTVDGMKAISPFFSAKVKNFHPLVHEQQEQNNINSSVDKSGVRSAHIHGLSAGPLADPSPANKATGTIQELPDKNMEKNAVLVSKREQCSEKKQDQVSGEAGRIFLLSLVRQFWEFAKKELYPDILLSTPEQCEILNLIWESVYGKFRLKATEKEWLKYQQTTLARIEIVARWLSRSCLHWIPKPHLYFHPNNNRNGFKKTWSWYVRQETLKIEVRNQLLLQQINAEWQQYDSGKGRFKKKSRLQLFRIQQKRLGQYRDESLMYAYHNCLQQNLHLNKLKDKAF